MGYLKKQYNIRLLFITSQNLLPNYSGASKHLLDIITFFSGKGFNQKCLWLFPPKQIRSRGIYRPPSQFRHAGGVIIQGGVHIKPFYLFPTSIRDKLGFKSRQYLMIMTGRKAAIVRHKNYSGPNHIWMKPPGSEELALALKTAQKFEPDVLITQWCWLNPIFQIKNQMKRKPLCVNIANDVFYKRKNDARKQGFRERFNLNKDQESSYLREADIITALCEEDVPIFQKLAPGKEILLIPKGEKPVTIKGKQTQGFCLMVGTNTQVNILGLEWFYEEVWPTVLEKCPYATLNICGGLSKSAQTFSRNVIAWGKVDDLDRFYTEAEVVVAPLLYGSGMKVKVTEALAHGKALVTTPEGVKGLKTFSSAVKIASSSDAFAHAIISFLSNNHLKNEYERLAIAQARIKLSFDHCFNDLYRAIIKHCSKI